MSQADVQAGSVVDTASVTAVNPQAVTLTSATSRFTVTGSAASAVTLQAASLSPSFTSAGTVVALRYTITNTGATTLTPSCQRLSRGRADMPIRDAGPVGDHDLHATYTVTQPDVDTGSITASSTVSATTPGGGTVVSPSSTVTVIGTGASRLT